MSEMGPVGPVVGSITVEVVADTSKVGPQIQQEMKGEAAKLQAATKQITSEIQRATAAQTGLSTSTQMAAVDLQAEYKALGLTGGALRFTTAETQQLAAATEQLQLAEIQHNAMLEKQAILTRQVGTETGKLARQQGEFRTQLRRVAQGEAPLSSLLSASSIARFGAAGLAIGAVFQGLGHLQEALEVTGDEAFTTEGKFRNFAAALTKGDIVGGFLALNKQADNAAEKLDKLRKSGEGTENQFRALAAEARNQVRDLQEASGAYEKLGTSGGAMGDAIRKAIPDLQEAASTAQALANAAAAGAAAMYDVGAAIAYAGSEAAAFGERGGVTGLRGVGAAAPGVGGGGGPPGYDTTATDSTANATALANARTDEQRLAVAKRQEEQAQKAYDNQKQILEGRAQRAEDLAEAKKRVYDIEQGIEARDAAEAARAQSEAERRAREAERLAKEQEAERKRIATAAALLAKSRIDLQNEVLNTRLQKAKLTDTITDDASAYRAQIAALDEDIKRQKAIANKRGVAEQVKIDALIQIQKDVQRQDEIRAQIKALKQGQTGGFSEEDLFAKAASEFRTFGGFSRSRSGILSPQDARGYLGASIGESAQAAIQRSLLAEQRKQTAELTKIAGNTSKTGPPKQASRTTPKPRTSTYLGNTSEKTKGL